LERSGLGPRRSACYGRATAEKKGQFMAEEEPILVSPPTPDVAWHVHDYMRFTKMLKWGAIICLIIGFTVLLILK
jgi:hypothetical protein